MLFTSCPPRKQEALGGGWAGVMEQRPRPQLAWACHKAKGNFRVTVPQGRLQMPPPSLCACQKRRLHSTQMPWSDPQRVGTQ